VGPGVIQSLPQRLKPDIVEAQSAGL